MVCKAWFDNCIMGLVVIAAALVGLDTYIGSHCVHMCMDQSHLGLLQILDIVVWVAFALESLLKIVSEGVRPWLYFTGYNYKWNWLDFSLVLLCIPFVKLNEDLEMLRLLRLGRLVKLVNKVQRLRVLAQSA